MGAIHFSIDLELLKALKSKLPLTVFVETGTFHGDTTLSVASMFDDIITIELSDVLFNENAKKFSEISNIRPIFGSSPDVIRDNIDSLKSESVVYWLDAHWCGETTAGKGGYECPLGDELEAIGSINDNSVVLIDDARMFAEPPPAAHNESEWPTIDSVIESLRKLNSNHKVWIINDVLIFAPQSLSKEIVEYSRAHGTNLRQLYLNSAAKENTDLKAQITHFHNQNTELLKKIEHLNKPKRWFSFFR